MKLSDAGALLIANSEGFSSSPYRKSGDVWTIGYGSTSGVGPGSPHVTRRTALVRLKHEVDVNYGAAVNRIGVPFTQNQYDALCSFAYNEGPGALGPNTGIGQALRHKNYKRAADELLNWTAGPPGTKLGLTRRRQAERELFLHPSPKPDPYRKLPDDERNMAHRIEYHREKAKSAKKGSALEKKHAAFREVWKARARLKMRRLAVSARTHGNGGWSRDGRGWRYQLLGHAVGGKK